MVMLAGGARVWVEVGGRKAKECCPKKETQGMMDLINCYIEAKEGKQFRIFYDNVPSYPQSQTSIELHVDGTWIACDTFCKDPKERETPPKGSFDGFSERQDGIEERLRAFVFGKTKTTDKESRAHSPKHLKDEGCSIRVDIEVFDRFGDIHHSTEPKYYYETQTASCVHKDTKPATIGLLTEPGKELTGNLLRECHCMVSETPRSHHRIVFKYLPKEKWLESVIRAEDIKAGRTSGTIHTISKDGVQEISRREFETGFSKVEDDEEEDKKEFKKLLDGKEIVSNKRRAGSEPPSARGHLRHIRKMTKTRKEKRAKKSIQLDLTGEDFDFSNVITPAQITVISDTEEE